MSIRTTYEVQAKLKAEPKWHLACVFDDLELAKYEARLIKRQKKHLVRIVEEKFDHRTLTSQEKVVFEPASASRSKKRLPKLADQPQLQPNFQPRGAASESSEPNFLLLCSAFFILMAIAYFIF